MGVRRAHERHVQRAVDPDVVEELAATGEQTRVLAAANGLAEAADDSHFSRGYDVRTCPAVKLRLYHHPDGARIAYREAGTGPPLALLHSQGLTHREFEPVVDALAHRHRVVLPDLPLHGDSEDRPNHPYTLPWLLELLVAFLHDTCGPRPVVAGHDVGALLALLAIAAGRLEPSRLVVLPSCMHTRPERSALEKAGKVVVRAAVVPGRDRALARSAGLVLRPGRGDRLTATDAAGRARPDPPRAHGPRRQRQPRPLLGQGRQALAARRAAGPARRISEDGLPGAAAVGRRRPRAPAVDRRRSAAPPARRAAAHRCRAPAS